MRFYVVFLSLFAFTLPAWAFGAITIPRFSKVNENIYRGSRPNEETIATLAHMKVLTILDLEDDADIVAEETAIAKRYGVKVISTPMSGFWWPSDDQVQLSLKILGQSTTQPIFVHCQHGEDRTGLIVGLYRVFYERWTPQAAWTEMVANGFHRILFLLKEYYERATGFEI